MYFHNSAIEAALMNLWLKQAVVTVKTDQLEITDYIEYHETSGSFSVTDFGRYIKFMPDSVLSLDFSTDCVTILVRS